MNTPALSRQDVAAELKVSLKTIDRQIFSGRLPAFKVGRQWRIHRDDMDEFMKKGRPPERK